MIDLTRLNGSRVVVNCDLIKLAEAIPDTTISLITGEKLIVCESCDQLIERVAAYRTEMLANAWPRSAVSHDASGVLRALQSKHAEET